MYRALISFSGLVTATKGQELDIQDKEIVKDLLKAGYIEETKAVKVEPKVKETEVKEPETAPKKKKKK